MISLCDTCPSFTGHVSRSDGSFRMPEVFNYLNSRKWFLLLFLISLFFSFSLSAPPRLFLLSLLPFLFPVSLPHFLSFSNLGSIFATLDHSLRNFFLGVCRTVESEGRPIDFGDLVPSSCVLHRLSEELFELVSRR